MPNQKFMLPGRWASLALLAAMLCGSGARADITINRSFTVNQDVPDNSAVGLVDTRAITTAGLSTISDVNVGLSISSASGTTMRLGQMYSTLTVGTASEGSRTAVLLNREGVSNTSAFGSAISFLNVTLDDSAPTNIYNATSGTGTYAPDGRLGVNPFGTRVAYDINQITAPLSALNGNWFDTWSLLVADAQTGNRARVNSWSLSMTGTAASAGTLDAGVGAWIQSNRTGTETIGATVHSGGAGASAVNVAAGNNQTMNLTGGLSGSGEFKKTGTGTIRIGGNSSNFTGTFSAEGGKVYVDGMMNAASRMVVKNGARLGGTGTVGTLEVASGGTLAPGNSPGQLNVAGDAIWAGGGTYEWEINKFLGGTAGTNYDFLNIAGKLTITATALDKFLIDVISLMPSNRPGDADEFYPTFDFGFAIATAAGGIEGSLDGLQLDASKFSNATTFPEWADQPTFTPGYFFLSKSDDGKSIFVNYARAIPEPSSGSLLAIGLGVALLNRRKRRA